MARRDGLEVRLVDDSHLFRDVGLWWHSERPLSRVAQAFIDLALASERPPGTLPILD
jgi:DNA-binding transcriptional LysR family regulator